VEDIKEDSQWIESEEIKPESVTLNKKLNTSLIKCGDYSIKYVTNEEVLNILKNRSSTNNLLLNAEHSHSDLITAVYEGGLKVWECTYDLLNFINDNDIDLSNKKVLDLGCGVGIIGIFSCLKGTTTFFQDYNSEVINQVTIPNILLNNIELDKCAFYCGDWKSFLDLLRPTFVNE
ncbi:histidine protein methyltransferase 1 -like, partial [Asbolus verrucosus]